MLITVQTLFNNISIIIINFNIYIEIFFNTNYKDQS
jgi:hypothetical protein